MSPEERRAALVEKRSADEKRSCRIWAKSEFVDFPVYRVPTELLVLNPENQRFRAEAQDVVRELGRSLEAEGDEDSIMVLLPSPPPPTRTRRVAKMVEPSVLCPKCERYTGGGICSECMGPIHCAAHGHPFPCPGCKLPPQQDGEVVVRLGREKAENFAERFAEMAAQAGSLASPAELANGLRADIDALDEMRSLLRAALDPSEGEAAA